MRRGNEKKGRNMILRACLRVEGLTQRVIADAAQVSQASVGSMLACCDRMYPKTREKIAGAIRHWVELGREYEARIDAGELTRVGVVSEESVLALKPVAAHDSGQVPPPVMRYNPDELLWRPQYYHEPTEDFVDLGPKMALDAALAQVHQAAEQGLGTRVKGPAVEFMVAAAADSEPDADLAGPERDGPMPVARGAA